MNQVQFLQLFLRQSCNVRSAGGRSFSFECRIQVATAWKNYPDVFACLMKLPNALVHAYFDHIKIVARPIFLTHIYMYAIGPHSMHRVGEESRSWVTQWMKFHRLPKSAQCKLFKLHPVITCNSILQELVKHKSHTASNIKLS